MGQRTEIAIVGELNLDLILDGLPRDLPEERELLASNFTMTLGSSSAILAHNLALLGTSVSFSASMASQADLKPDRTRIPFGPGEKDSYVY